MRTEIAYIYPGETYLQYRCTIKTRVIHLMQIKNLIKPNSFCDY